MNKSANIVLVLVLSGLAVTCHTTPVPSRVEPATVVIERPVHFLDSAGGNVIVPPGFYVVEWTAEDRLRLRSQERQYFGPLQTTTTGHSESVAEETAL